MKSFCLLVCLVTYWAGVTICAPPRDVHRVRGLNLKAILGEIKKYNQTQQKEDMTFLESVGHLAEGNPRCGMDFFCLTHEIFEKHGNATQHPIDQRIVKNLKNYIAHVNCSDILTPRNVTYFIQKKTFLHHIKMCIQCLGLMNYTSHC